MYIDRIIGHISRDALRIDRRIRQRVLIGPNRNRVVFPGRGLAQHLEIGVMIDITRRIHAEPLAATSGKRQVDIALVGMLRQRRAQKVYICRGNAVFATQIRVIVGNLLGQGPAGAVVASVVDVVLAGLAAIGRKAGAKGDVEVAAIVEAVVDHGRNTLGDRPVQFDIVVVVVRKERRSGGIPYRSRRAPTRASAHRARIGVTIEVNAFNRGAVGGFEH